MDNEIKLKLLPLCAMARRMYVSNKWLREKALSYFMREVVGIEGLKVSLIRGNQDTSIIKTTGNQIELEVEKEASLFNRLGIFHGHMIQNFL